MIDLQQRSSLPLHWSPSEEKMYFDSPLSPREPAIRKKADMEAVLYEPQADGPDALYYMYRDLYLPGDLKIIKEAGLRFDLTVIVPGKIGRELIKTAGHYHPLKEGTQLTYPEIYEVIHGTAHYLLQRKSTEDEGRIEEAFLFEAQPGDKLLIPPDFGHITINPGNDYLIMSNWVASTFSSNYGPIRRFRGGAYYEIQKEDHKEYIANEHYHFVPHLNFAKALEFAPLGLTRNCTLYEMLHAEADSLQCLVEPERFQEQFSTYREAWKEKVYSQIN
ncbi:MAG: glucose-6-phosphate isomerase family protein [Dethiobacteria bacterium]